MSTQLKLSIKIKIVIKNNQSFSRISSPRKCLTVVYILSSTLKNPSPDKVLGFFEAFIIKINCFCNDTLSL